VTPDQAEAIVARLAASFRARITPASRQAWTDAIIDLDHQAVTAAVDHFARTADKLPAIAALRAAATAGTPAADAATRWQVLVHWTDDQHRAYADPARWHTSERDAWADYHAAVGRAAGRAGWTVELLRYDAYKPVRTLERIP
jgi:hypothetical protein